MAVDPIQAELAVEDHEWHMFDVEQGLEVALSQGIWYLRHVDNKHHVEALTQAEFDALRRGEVH